jgi:hypothetical protein
MHMNEPVPTIADKTGVPVAPELEAVVMRLLQKDPAARPETAEAVIRLLEEVWPVVAGAGTSFAPRSSLVTADTTAPTLTPVTGPALPAPPAPAEPAPVGARRSAALPIAIAVVALAAIGGALVAMAGGGDAPRASPPTAALAVEPARPTPTPPALPTPATFTMFVESTPGGATVYQGDEAIGTTPTNVRLDADALERAPMRFRVTLDGHRAFEWTQGPAAADLRVHAHLEAEPAAVSQIGLRPRPRPRPGPAPTMDEPDRPPPDGVGIKTRR